VTYHRLFSAGRIGRLELPNRLVMVPMNTALASAEGEVTDHGVKYFEERAKGGVGLIVTEFTLFDTDLVKAAGATGTRLDSDRFIPMLSRLADAVHKHDTRIFVQLAHPGRQGRVGEGSRLIAPSAVMCRVTREMPRALATDEIQILVRKFAQAAARAETAGIDGVEVHAAHGYLINQFMSPHTNTRTDEYGGTFENRLRFLRQIIEAVRERCGTSFALTVRMNADDFVEGGISLDMGKEIARYLEGLGVDALNVSGGTFESFPKVIEPFYYPQGWRVHLSKAVKEVVSIPVITAGVIREPEFAEQLLADEKADFIGIGRGFLADPEWANKARSGRSDLIRKCISCNHCVRGPRAIACAVNARAGKELEFAETPPADGQGRRVIVIGGGPGGMEAARVLAGRGFEVVLADKSAELGGRLRVASTGPGKEKIVWLRDYLVAALGELPVSLRTGTEFTLEMLKDEQPYAVVVAAGAQPYVPKIDGLEKTGFVFAEDVILGLASLSGVSIAVLGGGFTGCEAAEILAQQGKRVTIIEMMPIIGPDVERITRMELLDILERHNVELLPSHRVAHTSGLAVMIDNLKNGSQVERQFDHIVLAAGMVRDTDLADRAKTEFTRVKLVGDAKSPGMISGAIRDGLVAGYTL